jgi:hypothetical protein
MSMFGGLSGGDSKSYNPQEAPKPPKRSDEKLDKKTMKYYQKLKEKDSYATTLLGGSAAQPTKSYTAQLFGTGSMM